MPLAMFEKTTELAVLAVALVQLGKITDHDAPDGSPVSANVTEYLGGDVFKNAITIGEVVGEVNSPI